MESGIDSKGDKVKGKIFVYTFVSACVCLIVSYFLCSFAVDSGSYYWRALPFLLLSIALAVAFSYALSLLISRAFTRKITEVKENLKSLNAGEYEPLDTAGFDKETALRFEEMNTLNENTVKTMQRVERELEKLKAVLDNVAQGIVAMNEKNEVVFVNASAIRIFHDGRRVLSNKLSALVDDEKLLKKITKKLGEEKEFSFEYEYREQSYAVSGRTIAETNKKGETSRLLILTDLTHEKQMIKQKSDFFANASHELKTPLTVMRGLTELLMQDESLDERGKKQVERIHKESMQMTSLISDMLKISKLERGEAEEERADVDLREIANEAVAELSVQMRAKSVSAEVEGSAIVFADGKKMFELLQNLCSNAVNYNKENGWIKITLSETEKNATLCVADGGIGIAKEHLPRLCERFYRVDKSRSKKTGGTGLGLSIVKHICALYNAELTIDSEIGVGTRVTVVFNK